MKDQDSGGAKGQKSSKKDEQSKSCSVSINVTPKEETSTQNDTYYEKMLDAYLYSQGQFDKNVLFIASGALGVSFAFIEKIVKLSDTIDNWILILSWILLCITMICSLFSHNLGIRNVSKGLANMNLEDTDYESLRKRLNRPIVALRYSMMIGILLGISFIILFVAINQRHLADKVKKETPKEATNHLGRREVKF